MNVNLLVIVVCVLSLIIGALIGIKAFKIYNKKLDEKLLENAEQVLDGKRDNKIKIDGTEYDATKFRVKDGNGKEITIDLQGGGIVQDGRREKERTGYEEIQKQEVETLREKDNSNREDSGCTGEKKRDIGIRSVFSRKRRFG